MEIHRMILGNAPCLILTDHSLILQVYLISYDYDGRVLVFHLVDALDPVRDGFVGLLVGHVEA